MQYFAHIANSSPCLVHKDFRMIVHLSKSELEQTDLQFLGRFEKYTLSIEDVLRHYTATRSWKKIKYKVNHQLVHTSTLDLLQQGIENFVEVLHINPLKKNPLYGFGSHSLPSYLLNVAMNTPTNAKFPEVRIPLQFKHKRREEPPHNVELVNELRKLIKYSNFRLLQIARTEYVVECKILPREYVSEYLIKQEHDSVITFLHQAIVKQYGPKETTILDTKDIIISESQSDVMSRKWCIFTRSSNLLYAPSENIRRWVFDSILASLPGLRYECLQCINVSNIYSKDMCRKQLEEFRDSKTAALVYIVDMNDTTSAQLNILRRYIDIYLTDSCLVFMIMHYKSDQMEAKHQANFLNGWDYIYINSFKITDVVRDFDEDVDARSWIGWVHSLPSSDTKIKYGSSTLYHLALTLKEGGRFSKSLTNTETKNINKFYRAI
eukprot:TRINITY_DN5141_c1_g2_i1.p2 TRINITY_DN5141_c1_g2~~TRINITY_DN5141_c1_g2_i1.p2  ORF type:complete len:455 (+),score=42.24 TRINITY_DN5141_c1_g2_i1:58-1365(+)